VIQKQSILFIFDNSGVFTGLCISTPLGFLACVGDRILISIKSCCRSSKLRKGSISKALIVKLKNSDQRLDGSSLSFYANGVVLLDDQGHPLAKRITGPISFLLRKKKFFKVLFLASVVL
jgi:large subunit ribosomal protein L14